MKKKINWGVLSTASIGTEKVIPAMQQCEYGQVVAIASRDHERAVATASRLAIEKAYDSYDALLADDTIDAIYNPLPNHLHVQWAERALAAGKHVLCEKPIGLDVAEAISLRDTASKFPELKAMEAFMYRFHPQWLTVRGWIEENQIGRLLTVNTIFSYFNDNPDNIRNQADIGGGGLMDIGCYPISQSRFLFAGEPQRVFASMEIHPEFGTDVIASAVLDFGSASATFTCSTQMYPYQRVHILGTEGHIEIEIPVNAPANESTKIWLRRKDEQKEVIVPECDQYTLQADALAKAVIDNEALPVTLDDAVANMRVIDACVKSHQSGCWETIAE